MAGLYGWLKKNTSEAEKFFVCSCSHYSHNLSHSVKN